MINRKEDSRSTAFVTTVSYAVQVGVQEMFSETWN